MGVGVYSYAGGPSVGGDVFRCSVWMDGPRGNIGVNAVDGKLAENAGARDTQEDPLKLWHAGFWERPENPLYGPAGQG
jgi:hypothetical protein